MKVDDELNETLEFFKFSYNINSSYNGIVQFNINYSDGSVSTPIIKIQDQKIEIYKNPDKKNLILNHQ